MSTTDEPVPDAADDGDVREITDQVSGASERGGAAEQTDAAATAVDDGAGDVLVKADIAGTVLFAITASLAAGFFTTTWQWVAAITAMVLFAVGVFAFLWSYYNAVQRSRHDEIGVAQLYLLLGPPTPPRVRRTMLGLLALQFVVAMATTFARLDGPDGKPGSSLALGFLVPMLGFGLNGLWAAYHGDFPTRRDVVAE